MINYDKPNSLIYSYRGTVASSSFKTLFTIPVNISPSITDGYIQLVKFTIALSLKTGYIAPPNFDLLILNSASLQGGMLLSSVQLSGWNYEPVSLIYEFNMNETVSNWTYESTFLPNNIILSSNNDDAAREIADASYTLLYTKYTI